MNYSSQSQPIVTEIMQSLMQHAKRQIYINKLISNNLSQYCTSESLKYYHEVYNENSRNPENKEFCALERQPNALVYDNFFPTATAVEQPEKLDDPDEIKKSTTSKISKIKVLSRNNTQKSFDQNTLLKNNSTRKTQNSQAQFQRLNIQQQQSQQTMLKQLRKQRLTEDTNRAMSLQNEQREKREMQNKKKNVGDKVSYDYNGTPIKMKSQNRNNLITSSLNGQVLKDIEKIKYAEKNNVKPTQIQYDRKDKKNAKVFKSSNEIELSNTFSLISEAKVVKGIKIKEDGRVLQEKQKALPLKQLLKTLGSRKLNKQQYRKIKQTSGKMAQFDQFSANKSGKTSMMEDLKSQENMNLSKLRSARSASESQLSNIFSRQNKSYIIVEDLKLLETLISREEAQPREQKSERINNQQLDKKAESRMSANDHYNLQYIKSGGASQAIKESRSITQFVDVKLPKINSNRNQMPKMREKLKDKQDIIRSIRRKFQQKLRI